jgi:hypothetical protein
VLSEATDTIGDEKWDPGREQPGIGKELEL